MQADQRVGQLSDEDEKTLGDAIAEAIDDFGPDFDEEGNALEEGESDRVREHREEGRDGEDKTEARGVARTSEREEVPA